MRRFITAAALVLALSAQAQAWDGGFISNFGWVNDLLDYFRPTPKKPERSNAPAQNATAAHGYKQAIEAYEKQRRDNASAVK